MRLQTKVKNHVHAILLKHGYQAPVSDVFGVRGRAWLSTLPLRPVYQHSLHGFLQILETLRGQIQSASRLIDQEAQATALAQRLCTLPGVGHYTALLLLAEIGDIRRFPSPKHLVSYAGLARWILVEVSHHASRKPGRFQQLYERLAKRKGPRIASVAVARELLTTTYWMLRHVH